MLLVVLSGSYLVYRHNLRVRTLGSVERLSQLGNSLKVGISLSTDENHTSKLEEQLKLLANEYQQLRTYEKQLRDRASTLDILLDEAIRPGKSSSSSTKARSSRTEDLNLEEEGPDNNLPEDGGIGGGEGGRKRLSVFMPSFHSRLFRKSAAETDTLSLLEHQSQKLSHIPIGSPVYGKRTSDFGMRVAPYGSRVQLHEGLDIGVDEQSIVKATAEGLVVDTGYKGALGNIVKIDHGNGIATVYGHLGKITVAIGERVCRGERIGYVGMTGRTTGPHLHYQVEIGGIPKNPTPFVQLARILRSANIQPADSRGTKHAG